MKLQFILISLLLSVLIIFLFGHFLGQKGVFYFSALNMSIVFMTSIFMFVAHLTTKFNFIEISNFGSWITLLNLNIEFIFVNDMLSSIMVLIVSYVSFLVHLYSIYYMKNDINSSKFMGYLTLFTFFMIVLVSSSNFLLLFVGWEGVGLCSFLLISFWSTRTAANKSAIKAMLINRVGDFFLMFAIVIIFITFKTIDFFTVSALVHVYSSKIIFNTKVFGVISVIDIISFFLVIGAITKSAQIGFHGWLPDATEGPTPVSASIHAATTVTAGVYLLIRCSFFIEFSNICLNLLVYISSLTIVIFGLIGCFQYDIKKIIAFSTCSQLGYMVLACGLSGYNFALYHLVNHASFKALLFLSAGSIIHFMNNEQDIRKLSGIFFKNTWVCTFFLLGTIAIVGIPFFSGYYSKDLIINLSFFYKNKLIFILANFGVLLTTVYSVRLVYFLMFKENFNFKYNTRWVNEKFDIFNFFPLCCLTITSIIGGYFLKNVLSAQSIFVFNGSIFILPEHFKFLWVEFIPFWFKTIPLFLIVLGTVFTIKLYENSKQEFLVNDSVSLFFNKKIFFDSIINFWVMYAYVIAFKIFFLFDKGILEYFGPLGAVRLQNFFFLKLVKNGFFFGNNKIYSYFILFFLYLCCGLMFFFIFYFSAKT